MDKQVKHEAVGRSSREHYTAPELKAWGSVSDMTENSHDRDETGTEFGSVVPGHNEN